MDVKVVVSRLVVKVGADLRPRHAVPETSNGTWSEAVKRFLANEAPSALNTTLDGSTFPVWKMCHFSKANFFSCVSKRIRLYPGPVLPPSKSLITKCLTRFWLNTPWEFWSPLLEGTMGCQNLSKIVIHYERSGAPRNNFLSPVYQVIFFRQENLWT